MTRKVFICTDTSKLKELGFKEESKNNYIYYNGISRGILVYQRNEDYYISFIHYSHNVLSVFKKMIEMKIIKEIEIPYYTRDSELNRLKNRIEELERKLNNE